MTRTWSSRELLDEFTAAGWPIEVVATALREHVEAHPVPPKHDDTWTPDDRRAVLERLYAASAAWPVTRWNQLGPDHWPHTPPLDASLAMLRTDPDLVWRMDEGDLVNVLEMAADRIAAQQHTIAVLTAALLHRNAR